MEFWKVNQGKINRDEKARRFFRPRFVEREN